LIKRLTDLVIASMVLILLSPLLLVVSFLIWLQDRRSPFYIAERVGRDEKPFRMVKFRSMVVNADKSGVDSTSANDSRITPIGRFVRKTKLDEIPQMWNVLKGEMSLVGPRPNVSREVALYTELEKHLLDVRPGITDYASIVFADEGDILADTADPDIAYNQLIRPGKSRLGLFYVSEHSFVADLRLLFLTVVNAVKREKALAGCASMLGKRGAPEDLVRIATRVDALTPTPPPGADQVVTRR
jgi:lipopolysaccharide/colanic/teichoic acid biosynthesis glycosyltransferase